MVAFLSLLIRVHPRNPRLIRFLSHRSRGAYNLKVCLSRYSSRWPHLGSSALDPQPGRIDTVRAAVVPRWSKARLTLFMIDSRLNGLSK